MDNAGPKIHSEEHTSSQSATITASPLNAHEDRGQLGSLSHSPSPKLTSILIHPSDSGASRPRSSEGKINLPKETLSRGHRPVSTSLTLKKRSIGAQGDKVLERESSVKTDPFLNFGIGDGFQYSEDPLILEDVQKALNVKARRLTQQRNASQGASQESHESFSTPRIASKSNLTTETINAPFVPSPFQYQSKLYFPLSPRASSLSLQSNSSEDLSSKSPVPMLISLPDGHSYLDWSGDNPLTNQQLKDKSSTKTTFSFSKNKFKPRESRRKGASLGLRASQGDLHVALLDNIRRTVKRDTLLRAEKTKEELGRRYSFLSHRKSTGQLEVNPLMVLRARQDDSPTSPSWYSWRTKPSSQISRWTLTADNIDEYLCSIGMPSTQSDSNRSRSPAFRFSPLSSPRPSFSSSPSSHIWKEVKGLNPSLTTSMAEVVNSSRPILSLNADTLPMSSRISLQAPSKNVTDPVNKALVPTGQPEITQRERSPTKTESGHSFGRRLRASLNVLAKDSVNPSAESSKHTHVKSTSDQDKGLNSTFANYRKSGDEAISRSSVSDEGDSVANINLSKREPNNITRKATSLTVPVDTHKSKSRDRGRALNTSESETGTMFFHPYRTQDRVPSLQGSLSAGERNNESLGVPSYLPRRSIRQGQFPDRRNPQEELQKLLNKLEEKEEQAREVYKRREQLLIEANDHNRKIARLLKGVCNSLREYERTRVAFAGAGGTQYNPLPREVVEAINSDPATTLRHGKGWRAVEHSYELFHRQQATLSSYISQLSSTPSPVITYKLDTLLETAKPLWENLQKASEQIESRAAMVEPALYRAVEHVESVQKEYNYVQMLTETDYPENHVLSDLETYILESQAPRGWLEFAAIWVPVHVLEVVGGFIRFFGVPISEKFIRPFLWYFFRDQYYWKLYSTEPPPNGSAWYTRLAYWLVIISILAWHVTPRPELLSDVATDVL